MSFVQRELDRISKALLEPRLADDTREYSQLYAAQQALAWALEPTGFKPPYSTIRDNGEGSEDCPSSSYPGPSGDNRGHDDR